MEKAVREHVKMVLQYSTSTAFCFLYKHFMDLVKEFPPPPTTTPHPLAAIMLRPSPPAWPNEQIDTYVHIIRDEKYAVQEQYLANHLPTQAIQGIGLEPHETDMNDLTDATVDAVIDHGLMASAIVVLDTFLDVRKPILRACLERRLMQRKKDWPPTQCTRVASVFTIVSLCRIKMIPAEITTIFLDLSHLWGTEAHFQWLRFLQHVRDRALTITAVGWKNVPPIQPGWSLNDLFGHESIEAMLSVCQDKIVYRTHEQLVGLAAKMIRSLVVLAPGTTDASMALKKARSMAKALGSQTRFIGLCDLPLYLLQQPMDGAILLVLYDETAAKMQLDHWMLLLSHMRDRGLLIVTPAGLPPPPAMVLLPDPIAMITGWIEKKKTIHPLLSTSIHKTLPW